MQGAGSGLQIIRRRHRDRERSAVEWRGGLNVHRSVALDPRVDEISSERCENDNHVRAFRELQLQLAPTGATADQQVGLVL